MTLARVVVDSPHAVQRDLLCHRFRWANFGDPEATELSFPHFLSFVMGAEPTSALGNAVRDGWTTTDHLLANLTEQQAGLIQLGHRYSRPGLPAAEPDPERPALPAGRPPVKARAAAAAVGAGGRFSTFDSPVDFQAKLAEHRARKHKLPNKPQAQPCPKTG
jgi:hypothetical protein